MMVRGVDNGVRAILEVASDTPRRLSVHSHRATGLVARELREFRPHVAILHWWLGSPEETEAAVAAGAYFSVNASQARSWKSLRLVPADRLLLETVREGSPNAATGRGDDGNDAESRGQARSKEAPRNHAAHPSRPDRFARSGAHLIFSSSR